MSVLLEQGHEVVLFDGGQRHDDPAFKREVAERISSGRRPTRRQWRRLLGLDAGVPVRDALRALGGDVDPRAVQKKIVGSGHVFRGADDAPPGRGTWLPRSLAVGGLADAWGAACYTPRATDYDWIGLDAERLRPWLIRAMGLLGVTGTVDGLSEAYPDLGALIPLSSARDPASPLGALVGGWDPAGLAKHGLEGGRARLAVDAHDDGGGTCVRCGLCALGCAVDAIWSPRAALDGPPDRLTHRPGGLVLAVEESDTQAWVRLESGDREGPFEAVYLAAGALGSPAIARRSLGLCELRTTVSENDVYLLPFVPLDPRHWQRRRGFGLSEGVLAIGPGVAATGPVHAQLYRVSLPLLGPLGRALGAVPRLAARVLDRAAGLGGLAFVYLHGDDSRRHRVVIDDSGLAIEAPTSNSASLATNVAHRLVQASAETGLLPLAALLRPTGPGTSVHLAGTLPMRDDPGPAETDLAGRLHGLERTHVVDASTLPSSPAQNLTLIAVANAMRIAAGA